MKAPALHLPIWMTTEARLRNWTGKTNTVPFREQHLRVQTKKQRHKKRIMQECGGDNGTQPFFFQPIFLFFFYN